MTRLVQIADDIWLDPTEIRWVKLVSPGETFLHHKERYPWVYIRMFPHGGEEKGDDWSPALDRLTPLGKEILMPKPTLPLFEAVASATSAP